MLTSKENLEPVFDKTVKRAMAYLPFLNNDLRNIVLDQMRELYINYNRGNVSAFKSCNASINRALNEAQRESNAYEQIVSFETRFNSYTENIIALKTRDRELEERIIALEQIIEENDESTTTTD